MTADTADAPSVAAALAAPAALGSCTVLATPGGDVTVLSLHGALDLAVAGPLRRALDEACARSAATGHRVVVDVSGVGFVDSTALGALTAAFRDLRRAGGALRLAGAGEQTRLVLRLTNLAGVLGGDAPVGDAAAAIVGATTRR
ncbi:STAS domain-containing protein [Nocardioides perillae]|uniref:Anti-sigma B factor antagonist n=1 Tax=Nocardioides perillae TaxID=1119534 RepID=A0A7Y9UJE1_9ACTN|nr:STAS domain-containing protein [Nocardioides perillae]NYG54118.1 anti-sigma B factor antagonist [Nocardioides perillae]